MDQSMESALMPDPALPTAQHHRAPGSAIPMGFKSGSRSARPNRTCRRGVAVAPSFFVVAAATLFLLPMLMLMLLAEVGEGKEKAKVVTLTVKSASDLAKAIRLANKRKEMVVVNLRANIKLERRLPLIKPFAHISVVGQCKRASKKRCIIDGVKRFPMFVALNSTSCSVWLDNVVVQNARNGVLFGGCNFTTENSIFKDNWSGFGGPVIHTGFHEESRDNVSAVLIRHCTFLRNIATGGDGGAVGCSWNGPGIALEVADSIFLKNEARASSGGAIGLVTSHEAKLISVTFTGNFANDSGGAFHSCCGKSIFIKSKFIENNAQHGKGGAVASYMQLQVCHSHFDGNTAPADTNSSNIMYESYHDDFSIKFCPSMPSGVRIMASDGDDPFDATGGEEYNCTGCSGCGDSDCHGNGRCHLDSNYRGTCICRNGYDQLQNCGACVTFRNESAQCKTCKVGFLLQKKNVKKESKITPCRACPGLGKVPFIPKSYMDSATDLEMHVHSEFASSLSKCVEQFHNGSNFIEQPRFFSIMVYYERSKTQECNKACILLDVDPWAGDLLCSSDRQIHFLPEHGLHYLAIPEDTSCQQELSVEFGRP